MSLPQFTPLGVRARLAVALLAVTIVIDIVSIAFDFLEVAAIDDYVDGTGTASALESSDQRQAVIGALVLIAFVATAVFFIRWFHAAYRNIATLGAGELRFTPGWAIGAWFVPFLNLWRPKQIADDVWRASDPDAPPAQGLQWREAGTAGLLTVWWALWLLASVGGNIASRTLFAAETLADFRDSAQLNAAICAIDIAGAVVAILVVRRITSRQLDRRSRLSTLAPVPAGTA